VLATSRPRIMVAERLKDLVKSDPAVVREWIRSRAMAESLTAVADGLAGRDYAGFSTCGPVGPPGFQGETVLRVTPVLVEGRAKSAEVRKSSQARRARGWASPVECWVE
jgi:hypothetical protein